MTRFRGWRRLVAAAGALSLLLVGAAAQAAGYELMVVPQFQASEIQRDWQPLLDRLRQETGVELKLRHARSIPEFEAEFLHGTPDFVYLNPYHMVMAQRAQGYRPMVRDTAPLRGILVVRKDSPVTALAMLDQQTIAFPAPNAFGASLYMRALLAEAHGLRITPRYVKTHGNVFRHVLVGEVPAGGAIESTLAHESADVRDRLRILFETPSAAPHPLAAHPRVPEEVRRRIGEAIVRFGQSAETVRLVAACQMPKPIAADFARDYQPLARLNLERYVVNAE